MMWSPRAVGPRMRVMQIRPAALRRPRASPITRRTSPMILCVNQTGPPVLAVQNALRSVLGSRAINAANGVYGKGMAADVSLYRTTILGVPAVADGLMCDAG